MNRSNLTSASRILLVSCLIILLTGCRKEEQIPVVTTGTVSNITSTSVTIAGNTNNSGGGNTLSRGICWSNILTKPNINEDFYFVEGFGSGSFTISLAGLTPGTTYYLRAFATNGVGTGYGSVVTFTTTGSITGTIVFNPDLTYETVTDRDGNMYKTIQIGTQTWMAENLKTTKYNDGTDIPNITDYTEWKNHESPAYCWHLNDITYKDVFGAMYNYSTVKTGNLCPAGWHVPGYDEWMDLFTYLGNNEELGNHLREAGESHWIQTGSDADNSSGFTALPGGWRNLDNANFSDLGYNGNFWAYPASDLNYNNIMFLYQGSWEGIFVLERSGLFGCSVRCIKD